MEKLESGDVSACRKCKQTFAYQLRRTWLMKALFFLPSRRYYCTGCFQIRYVFKESARPGN